jgi:hypothetical protein
MDQSDEKTVPSTPEHRPLQRINVFDKSEIDSTLGRSSTVLNHSKSMLAVYHTTGFTVYRHLKPIVVRSTHSLTHPVPFGVNHFAFVYECMVFVLVPNQKRGRFGCTKVVVWDEEAEGDHIVSTIDTFKPINAIASVKELLAVSSLDRIALYNLNTGQPVRFINKLHNTAKLTGSLNYHTFLVAFPFEQNLACINLWNPNSGPFRLRSAKPTFDQIDSVSMSQEGDYVACSYLKPNGKGRKEIKIYSTRDREELYAVIVPIIAP